jgi:iron complex outermembrane recepter protein
MDGNTITRITRIALFSVLLIAACCSNARGAEDIATQTRVEFNLPSGPFPQVILEFYRQSHIEVLFLSKDELDSIYTNPVVGKYEPKQALDIMLSGTPLIYNFATEHSVSIKEIPPPSEAPTPNRKDPHVAGAAKKIHDDLSLVTITGSFIRGAVDVRAPVVDVSQKDLSYAAFPSIQDALYQLPMVSLNAPREDLGIDNNYNWGAAINLRGLGVGATLVLVNGRRQPLSGSTGDFVDVSNIPVVAVDRIEILPQGASGTYGSDAIAGVVNVILRDHFDGAETAVHYGGTPGGRDDVVASQLLGTHWENGNVMMAYQYSDATVLPITARGYAASADKQPYGGADYRSSFTDPGNIVDAATLQPLYGGTAETSAATPDLTSAIRSENNLAQYDLFAQATQHSVYMTGRQELGPLELFSEIRLSQRNTYVPETYEETTVALGPNNPFNPFPGSSTLVDYSFGKVFGPAKFADETRDYVATVGARLKLGEDWEARLSSTYGQERLYADGYDQANALALATAANGSTASTAFNPFGATNASVLQSIRAADLIHATSDVDTTELVTDGPLFALPGGTVKLAGGFEDRLERLDRGEWFSGQPSPGQEPIDNRFSRHVGSAFSELLIPVLGDPTNPHATPRLELTLAGRYDDYRAFGHATNPELGIRFAPAKWLKLRASAGRSFRAPQLDELYDTSNNASGLLLLPDPKSPSGQSLALVEQGNNPNLRPETAKSWVTGFDVVPDFDPDLVFSVSHYSIDYTGQIAIPDVANVSDILAQASEWPGAITRNPTAAQIAAVCQRPDYQGSVTACLASRVAAIVNIELSNLASTETSGLDLNIDQKITTDAGLFDLGLVGNYVFHFDEALTTTTPAIDILNTAQNPLKLRIRAIAAWDGHLPEDSGFGATIAVNFTNGYRNPGSTLLPEISSLTTVDLQLCYHRAEQTGWLGGLDFTLNAANVLNQSPPFVDTERGYDSANSQPLGRVLRLSASKKW